jgi:hypothetical protein
MDSWQQDCRVPSRSSMSSTRSDPGLKECTCTRAMYCDQQKGLVRAAPMMDSPGNRTSSATARRQASTYSWLRSWTGCCGHACTSRRVLIAEQRVPPVSQACVQHHQHPTPLIRFQPHLSWVTACLSLHSISSFHFIGPMNDSFIHSAVTRFM